MHSNVITLLPTDYHARCPGMFGLPWQPLILILQYPAYWISSSAKDDTPFEVHGLPNTIYNSKCLDCSIRICIQRYAVDVERFVGLNDRSFNSIKAFVEIFSHCLGQKCSLFSVIKKSQLCSQKIFFGTLKSAKVQPSESFHIYGTVQVELPMNQTFDNLFKKAINGS